MTYDFRRVRRVASAKKPLYGHTSPETAYVQDDYPHGFRDRCKRRTWLEFKAKQGYRIVHQTSQSWYPGNGEGPPPDDQLRWAKPKASTYAPIAGCLYLDAQDHIQWDQIGGYAKPSQCAAFMSDFPKADFGGIKALALANIKYAYQKLHGAVAMTMNDQLVPWSESDLADARKGLGEWIGVAKEAKLSLKADFLKECEDLVDGKTPAKVIDPDAWKAEQKQKQDEAAASAKEKADNTKGAMTQTEFMELLGKKVDAKDRILRIRGDSESSIKTGQVFVTLYNIPKSENTGVNSDNNRFSWHIEGFDRRDENAKAVKIKIEQGPMEGAPREDRGNYKLRGKSATPQQIAEYLAKHIHKIVAEVEPRLSKYASDDRWKI